MLYKQVELEEGNYVQYLGVYVLRWQKEWGEPQVGFVEQEYTLDDALEDLDYVQLIDNTGKEAAEVRKEIECILRKFVGESNDR
jgi:hypothetical protein